jgi:hypothetical protein
MKAGSSYSSEEDSNSAIFLLNSLHFEASNCRLATVLSRALAVFDFPEVEDEEDGL